MVFFYIDITLFKKRQKQKILVTGANGQLGRELKQLAPSVPHFDFIFLSKEELPIHDVELVKEYFQKNHPQYLINCAAYTAVDKAESEKELAFQINGEAVGVLATSCRDHHCKFIHISYEAVIIAKFSGIHRSLELTLPIVIETIPLNRSSDLSVNPSCLKDTSNETEEKKKFEGNLKGK